MPFSRASVIFVLNLFVQLFFFLLQSTYKLQQIVVEKSAANKKTMSRKQLLAFNYDLLCQLPVHRKLKNARVASKLTEPEFDYIVSEEMLLNECLDIIEFLANNDKAQQNAQQQKEKRLQTLLPLLLYRYRDTAKLYTREQTPKVLTNQDDSESDSKFATESAPIVKNQREMRVLPYNFRPFNSNQCFEDWPLGRNKEVEVLTTSADFDSTKNDEETKGNVASVHYVVEPIDKKAWLFSKRDKKGTLLRLDQLYANTALFFDVHAPRLRAIRKARLRNTTQESREFRKWLFETPFYDNLALSLAWHELFEQSFEHWQMPSNRKIHLVANLLAVLQPQSTEQALQSIFCLDDICMPHRWLPRLSGMDKNLAATQIDIQSCELLTEKLLRSTVYDLSEPVVNNKNNCLHTLLSLLQKEQNDTDIKSTVLVRQNRRAALLYWFTCLRSRFSDTFCAHGDEDRKMIGNTFSRLIVAVENVAFQRLRDDQNKCLNSDQNTCSRNQILSNGQLWMLSENLITFLRVNFVRVDFDALDFVKQFMSQYQTLTDNFTFDAQSLLQVLKANLQDNA